MNKLLKHVGGDVKKLGPRAWPLDPTFISMETRVAGGHWEAPIMYYPEGHTTEGILIAVVYAMSEEEAERRALLIGKALGIVEDDDIVRDADDPITADEVEDEVRKRQGQ